MAKQKTITPNSGIIANNYGYCRVDKRHLHDLAVSSEDELGIRKLESSHEDLLIYFTAIPNFHMRSIEYSCRSYLHMGTNCNIDSPDYGKKSNIRVGTNSDVLPTYDGTKTN
jgi:hypothetical protein